MIGTGSAKVNRTGDVISGNITFSTVDSIVTFTTRGYVGLAGGNYIGFGVSPNTSYPTVLNALFFPTQAPTASAPAYVKGGCYFDTTLNKLRIGGAAAWETVTSA